MTDPVPAVSNQRYPWGPRRVAFGLLATLGAFAFTNALVVVLIIATGQGVRSEDSGDLLEQMLDIAAYADARLEAAASGAAELPQPPELLADIETIQIGLAVGLFFEAALIAIAGIGTGLDFGAAMRTLGLNRYRWSGIWRPVLAVIGCYTGIVVYALIAEAVGIGPLIPNSTLPNGVARDNLALAMAGVVAVLAAPAGEEMFFRGFVFGGFSKWGFWPAALLSGGLFALVHFDPGSVIPFTGLGIVMAWLFWSRGSLWDSIIFHVLFNGTSYAFLLSTRQ